MQPIQLDLTEIFQTNNKKELLKNLNKIAKHSVYFHQLKKRDFHNPPDFVKWDEFLCQISIQLMSTDNIPIQYQDFVTINSSILLREIIEDNSTTFPCYWLNKNLLKAFENSDLPDVMGMKRYASGRLAPTHKYGVIFLPSGEMRSPDEKNINWIIFTHRLKDESSFIKINSSQLNKTYSEDMLQIFAMTEDDSYLAACSLERTDENKMPYRERNLLNLPKENEFIDKLLSITLQCLLWLQIYNPKESIPSGVGFRKKSASNIQNPRWIGKDYQPKTYNLQVKERNNKQSERKSPTAHERRGHWRSQRVGKGRSHIKTIWVEPCLVGIGNE